jgi:hypothetical protein
MPISILSRQRLAQALGNAGDADEIVNAVDHTGPGFVRPFSDDVDATHLGFFGTTAAVIGPAFTVGYSFSTHTISNVTAVPLVLTATAIAAATASATLTDANVTSLATLGASLNQAQKNLGAEINALVVDLANVKQVLNGVILDLMSFGLTPFVTFAV